MKSSVTAIESIYYCQEQGITCLVNFNQVEVAPKYAICVIAVKNDRIISNDLLYELYKEKGSSYINCSLGGIYVKTNSKF